jgi:VanZ family protein
MSLNKTQLGFAIYVIVVVVVSLAPSRGISTPGVIDKVGHFAVYAILVYLGLTAFKSSKAWIPVILFAIALGVILEFLQASVSGRDASIADGLANFLGVLVGTAIYLLTRDLFDR